MTESILKQSGNQMLSGSAKEGAGAPLLGCRDISVGYMGRPLFSPANFEIHRGECIFLCGANGSGKSTLLKTIAGILSPLSGEISCGCGDIPMIPSGIPKVHGFSLADFIRTGCYRASNWAGKLSPEMEKAVGEATETLGISALADREICSLSDGEFQKGCIAAALARRADIVLLDEPTAYLDAENRISVLAALKETAAKRGTAFIFSSHDLQDSAAVCSRVFAIGSDGIFRCSGTNREEKIKVISSIFRNKSIIFER